MVLVGQYFYKKLETALKEERIYGYKRSVCRTISAKMSGLTTVFGDTRLWKTKHPRKRFQNFPSILRVIDRSDRNPPITASSVTFWPSLPWPSPLWKLNRWPYFLMQKIIQQRKRNVCAESKKNCGVEFFQSWNFFLNISRIHSAEFFSNFPCVFVCV